MSEIVQTDPRVTRAVRSRGFTVRRDEKDGAVAGTHPRL